MLDQGIVITGDLLVKLMGLKLLPIKVRLLISSKKLASELGLDWWREEGRASSGRLKKRSKVKSNVIGTRTPARRNGERGRS